MRNTSATFVNPPSEFLVDDQVMPPLGIMYLSAWLHFNLIKSDILDLANRRIRSDFRRNDIPETTHYFFTATTPQYNEALLYMADIKCMHPDAIMVIGGTHATFRPEQCRSDGFDYVVVGEGECAALRIMQDDFNADEIKTGIIHGEIIQDLDYLPFPDRNFDGFTDYNYEVDGEKAVTMFTTRGCPFHCAFCAKMFDGVRMRSSSSVLREVEHLKKDMGFNAVMFFDDTFTVNKSRLKRICSGLKRMRMKWRCFIHASTVDHKILKMMKDSGCVEVGLGVESGNRAILETIDKRTDLTQIRDVIKTCHDIEMRIKIFLIAGLPGETVDTLLDTERFILETKPDDFDLTVFVPYPGNDIWNNPDNYDIQFDKEHENFSDMFYKGRNGEYVPMVATSCLTSEDIVRMRDEITYRIRRVLYKEQ